MTSLVFSVLFFISYVTGHQFWAEHNLICNVCQKSVEYVITGKSQYEILQLCKDKTETQFTTICDQVLGYEARILSMNDGKTTSSITSYEICQSLSMCTGWNDTEFNSKSVWNEELVNTINQNDSISWTAKLSDSFRGATLAQVRKTLGSIIDPDYVYKLPTVHSKLKNINLPTEFDSRKAWPYCASVIGHVRDQSECGSCWAFATTEAMNDRLCISNVTRNSVFTQLLSVEDTTACCTGVPCGYSAGCSGGMPPAAWQWFESDGVCSGGDYSDRGNSDTCLPYELPPCSHHQPSKDYTPCPSTEYKTPKCVDKCSNTGYPTKMSNDKHFARSAYSLRSVNSMMQDIVEYGSIAATMLVHEDFLSYKSGVYYWQNGQPLGGHAVKIFGYGIESGKHYWWCANSWNDEWGMNGFFKILKGTDESGIEDNVSAGLAKS